MPSEFSSNSQLKSNSDQALDKDGNGIVDTFESMDSSPSLNNSSLRNVALGWDDGFKKPDELTLPKAHSNTDNQMGTAEVVEDKDGARILKFPRKSSELGSALEQETNPANSINVNAEKKPIDPQRISQDVINLSEETGPATAGLVNLRSKVIERIASQQVNLGEFKAAAEKALEAA